MVWLLPITLVPVSQLFYSRETRQCSAKHSETNGHHWENKRHRKAQRKREDIEKDIDRGREKDRKRHEAEKERNKGIERDINRWEREREKEKKRDKNRDGKRKNRETRNCGRRKDLIARKQSNWSVLKGFRSARNYVKQAGTRTQNGTMFVLFLS